MSTELKSLMDSPESQMLLALAKDRGIRLCIIGDAHVGKQTTSMVKTSGQDPDLDRCGLYELTMALVMSFAKRGPLPMMDYFIFSNIGFWAMVKNCIQRWTRS